MQTDLKIPDNEVRDAVIEALKEENEKAVFCAGKMCEVEETVL